MARVSIGPRGSFAATDSSFSIDMADRTGLRRERASVPPPRSPSSPAPSSSSVGGGGAMSFVSPFASANSAQPIVVTAAFAPPPRTPPPSSAPVSPTRPSHRPISAGERPSPLPRTSIVADDVGRRRSVDVSAMGAAAQARLIRPAMPASRLSQERVDGRKTAGEPAFASESSSPRMEEPRDSLSGPTPTVREALFADHLSAILHHTMSLCTPAPTESLAPAPAYALETTLESESEELYSPPLTPDDSPRSSLTHESALEVIALAGTSPSAASHMSSVPPSSRASRPGRRLRRLPSLPSITPRRHAELVEMLGSWEFNAHELDLDELVECASIMFEAALLMQGIDSVAHRSDLGRLRALLISLRSAYHPRNPYHNFTHATDVLQAMYSFLTQLGLAPPVRVLLRSDPASYIWRRDQAVDARGAIGELIRPADVFTLMVAAIGHDVGHPGLSNAYMVNARTPVAQVYGDKSVLENFHSITLVHMLRRHGFGNLLDESAAPHGFRKVLAASVLATDMGNHFAFVANLQQMASRLKHRIRAEDEMEADRLLVCSGLMKCADISNPTRPHAIARAWSTALLEEWAEQARIEAEFKLPISVMTLNPAEKKAQAKSQVGFINLFTQPLFDAMTSCAQNFITFADACREGRRIWEAIVLQPDYACPPSVPSPLKNATTVAPPVEDGNAIGRPHGSPMSLARRRGPPRPLNTAATTGDRRRSTDSLGPGSAGSPSALDSAPSTASSLSPRSPRPHTPRSPAMVPVGSPLLHPTTCTGACAAVTEQCVECRQRSLELAEAAAGDDDEAAAAADLTLVVDAEDGQRPAAVASWPPYPFWPSQATLLKAAAAASTAAAA